MASSTQVDEGVAARKKGRGAFVLLEGIDHSGKTTQAALLCEALCCRYKIPAVVLRFPDRATDTGGLLDGYLRGHVELEGHAVHLLYSANRWEKAADLRAKLLAGTTVIVDRYAPSGVAYSVAKGLGAEWCMAADRGLPRPDAVLYLDLPIATALARGTAKQQERYDYAPFQQRVKDAYEHLLRDPSWIVVDADRPRQDVFDDLLQHAIRVIQDVAKTPDTPIGTLW